MPRPKPAITPGLTAALKSAIVTPGHPIHRPEWDFRLLPEGELQADQLREEEIHDATYYEYARESPAIVALADDFRARQQAYGDPPALDDALAKVATLLPDAARLGILAVCPMFPRSPWLSIPWPERLRIIRARGTQATAIPDAYRKHAFRILATPGQVAVRETPMRDALALELRECQHWLNHFPPSKELKALIAHGKTVWLEGIRASQSAAAIRSQAQAALEQRIHALECRLREIDQARRALVVGGHGQRYLIELDFSQPTTTIREQMESWLAGEIRRYELERKARGAAAGTALKQLGAWRILRFLKSSDLAAEIQATQATARLFPGFYAGGDSWRSARLQAQSYLAELEQKLGVAK